MVYLKDRDNNFPAIKARYKIVTKFRLGICLCRLKPKSKHAHQEFISMYNIDQSCFLNCGNSRVIIVSSVLMSRVSGEGLSLLSVASV